MMKYLHFVRHGQAASTSGSDKTRPLVAQGKNEAMRISWHLSRRTAWPPDVFYVSAATRTLETADFIVKATALDDAKVVKLDSLYAIDVHALFAEIKKFSDLHSVVAVCGHNPSMMQIAELLSGQTIGRAPTGSSSYLQIDAPSWKEITASSAKLLAFDTPAANNSE